MHLSARRFGLPLLILVMPLLAILAIAAERPAAASAHPLGNFTINRYSRLELYSDVVRMRYVLDMAEIPAFQEMNSIDANGDGQPSDDESRAYLTQKARELSGNLHLTLNGREAPLRLLDQEISYPVGQADLRTLRISLLLESAEPAGNAGLEYRDDNYADRIGWKEIVVRPAAGVTVQSSSAAADDISHELTVYPQGLLSSPLDVRQADARFNADAGAKAPPAGAVPAAAPEKAAERPGSGFASLVGNRHLTLGILVLALAAAFGFGAVHALEPGHGKTFVAAYFVGVRGTARQAMLLGMIVAVMHTIGVFAIGLLTLFGSQFILPEKLYPWLSLASAMLVLGLGVRLLAGRLLRRLRATGGADIHEGTSGHNHPHYHRHEKDLGDSPWKGLIALGLADGLTPSPSALVVLLAAVSLHRIGIGVLLILAFSLGLAAVLTGVSLGLVYARRLLERLRATRGAAGSWAWVSWFRGLATNERLLLNGVPLAAAGVLIVVGLVLTARALSQTGLGIV